MEKSISTFWRILLVCLGMSLVSTGSVQAEVGPWQDVPHGQVRLLTSLSETGDTILGVEVRLDPDWKIYWEYAGPVGQPTLFAASGLAEAQTATLFFPWPQRDRLQGFPSYGYSGRVLFPGLITKPADGAVEGPATAGQLQVGLSICSQTQCIPHRLSLPLPGSQATADLLVHAHLAQAFDDVPIPVAGRPELDIDLAGQRVSVRDQQGQDFLLAADAAAARAGFFLHAAQMNAAGGLSAAFDLGDVSSDTAFFSDARLHIDGPDGRYVFDTRDLAAHIRLAQSLGRKGDPAALGALGNAAGGTPLEAEAKAARLGLLGAAALLFLGGVLLNVMPCVLPVLFLKMKAVVTVGEGDRVSALRRSFGWTAVGIVGTFLLLGLALALVQLVTGLQLTLGAWLQFPLTTVVLAALVTLFIANAFGWFEFTVPSSVLSLGAGRQGLLGDLLAGMVAALLGGACAGVLLAVALSVAFAQPIALMVLLLGLMGLGLALPYVLVALIPGAARLIPKPGGWMNWVKPLIGLGLGVTLVYLVFIATRQLQLGAVVGLVALAAGALIALWGATRQRRAIVRWVGAGALALMVTVLPLFALQPDPEETSRNYSAEIATLVGEGERVLVDVTAFWCATCQTNKLLVLNTPDIEALFEETGTQIFTINADILADNISEFMAQQGRNSLPLNILFSPTTPQGEILPSVLTKKALRAAVERTL